MLRSKPLWPTYHVTSVSSEHYDYDIKVARLDFFRAIPPKFEH